MVLWRDAFFDTSTYETISIIVCILFVYNKISRVSDKHIEKLQGKKYKVMSAHR